MPSLAISRCRPVYGTGKKVAYTGTAGSTTVPAETESVILWCSSDAFVRIGGVATTADFPLPAGIVAQIPIGKKDGAPIIVSAIQDAAGGDLYCIAASE